MAIYTYAANRRRDDFTSALRLDDGSTLLLGGNADISADDFAQLDPIVVLLPGVVNINTADFPFRLQEPGVVQGESFEQRLAGVEGQLLSVESRRPLQPVEDFGAVGDGVTDDTAAINNAMVNNPGIALSFSPTKTYKVRTIIHRPGCLLEGWGRGNGMSSSPGIVGGTRLKGDLDAPLIQTPADAVEGSTGCFMRGATIQGFIGYNCQDALYWPNGVVGYHTHHLHLTPARYGIYGRGWKQEWFESDIVILGGTKGVYFPDEAGTLGLTEQMDKCQIPSLYLSGQSEHGWRSAHRNANDNTFGQINIVFSGGHGMVVGGAMAGMTIDLFGTESNGYLGVSRVAPTTGSISSTVNPTVLNVVSAAGLLVGDVLTVNGAGVTGEDLSATVLSIAGTAVTLDTAASTTVAAAEVTRGRYSDLVFQTEPGISGAPSGIHIGMLRSSQGALAQLLYSADLRQANNVEIDVARVTRPIYDPAGGSVVQAGQPLVRVSSNPAAWRFSNAALSNATVGGPNKISSPPGGDIELLFNDSVGDGTGNFGKLRVRRRDSNRSSEMEYDTQARELRLLRSGLVLPGPSPATAAHGLPRVFIGTAAPTTGAYVRGDTVLNSQPASGSVAGWTCVTAGSPGTWRTLGVISGGASPYDTTYLPDNFVAAFPRAGNNSSVSLISGTLKVCLVPVFPGQLLSRVVHEIDTVTSPVPTHSWGVIFSAANRQVLAVTADGLATALPGASAELGQDVLVPYTVPDGVFRVYMGLNVTLSSGSLTLRGHSVGTAGPTNLQPAVGGNSSTGQTTPPNLGDTMGAVTAANYYWAGAK